MESLAAPLQSDLLVSWSWCVGESVGHMFWLEQGGGWHDGGNAPPRRARWVPGRWRDGHVGGVPHRHPGFPVAARRPCWAWVRSAALCGAHGSTSSPWRKGASPVEAGPRPWIPACAGKTGGGRRAEGSHRLLRISTGGRRRTALRALGRWSQSRVTADQKSRCSPTLRPLPDVPSAILNCGICIRGKPRPSACLPSPLPREDRTAQGVEDEAIRNSAGRPPGPERYRSSSAQDAHIARALPGPVGGV